MLMYLVAKSELTTTCYLTVVSQPFLLIDDTSYSFEHDACKSKIFTQLN